MGKQLTAEQRAFIDRFITGKSPGEGKQITAAFVDFDRRRAKAEKWLDQLKPGADRDLLRLRLQAAVAHAQVGDFRGAYADLDEVKRSARGLAQGKLAALPLEATLQGLERQVGEIGNLMASADAGLASLTAVVARHSKPTDCKTYEQAYNFRQNLTEDEALWRGSVTQFQGWIDRAARLARQPEIAQIIASLAGQFDAAEQSGDPAARQQAAALAPRFADLQAQAQVQGKSLGAAAILAGFRAKRETFEALLGQLRDFGAAPPFDDQQRQAIAELDKAEQDRLERALEQVTFASAYDAAVLDPDVLAARAPARREIGTFRVQDLLPGDGDAVPGDPISLDDDAVQAMCGELAARLKTAKPRSDWVFDASLKTAGEFAAELAVMLGLGKDPQLWGAQADALQQAGAALHQTMADANPNQLGKDTLVLNGETYTSPVLIGIGGIGQVFRYENKDTGKKIIVKSPKLELAWRLGDAAMASLYTDEARAHWQLCGGEAGPPDPRVVKLEGVVIDSKGRPNLVMEEAEGGDLDTFGSVLNELERMGIITRTARAALTQNMVCQAAEALRDVHQQNELHLDIKAENFLVGADGRVMISDFGSVKAMDDDRQVAGPIATTPRYAPPEYAPDGGTYTPASDVFVLGAMVNALGSDLMAAGEDVRAAAAGGVKELSTNRRTTAFDRLRNAMLDPDPAQRPSLGGVIASSYLTLDGLAFDPAAIDALAAAVAQYSKAVGKTMKQEMRSANEGVARARGEAKQQGEKAAVEQDRLKYLHRELAERNAAPEIKPLVEAIRKAAQPFQG